jgi:hypothetical protein
MEQSYFPGGSSFGVLELDERNANIFELLDIGLLLFDPALSLLLSVFSEELLDFGVTPEELKEESSSCELSAETEDESSPHAAKMRAKERIAIEKYFIKFSFYIAYL